MRINLKLIKSKLFNQCWRVGKSVSKLESPLLPEAKLEKVENMEPNNFFSSKKEEICIITEGLFWQIVSETDLHLSYHLPLTTYHRGGVFVIHSSAFDN